MRIIVAMTALMVTGCISAMPGTESNEHVIVNNHSDFQQWTTENGTPLLHNKQSKQTFLDVNAVPTLLPYVRTLLERRKLANELLIELQDSISKRKDRKNPVKCD